MKTDRFSEIIRRKLESIRPEFTDKDWTRMQASLQQAMPPQPGSPATGTPFSGGVWSGSSWLLAAASVSTVVLIAFSIWQRSQINTLRQTVGQLKQQSGLTQPAPVSPTPDSPALTKIDSQNRSSPALETGTATDAKQPSPGNRDMASGTRYNASPNALRPEITEERATRQMDIPPKQRDAVADRAPVSVDDARPKNKSNKNLKTDQYGTSSTPLTNAPTVSALPVVTTKEASQSAPDKTEHYVETRAQPSESAASNVPDKQNRTKMDKADYTRQRNKLDKAGVVARQSVDPIQRSSEATTAAEVADKVSGSPADPGEATETYKLATSLPLSLPDRDWNAALIRRAKRMRPVQPMISAPTTSPLVAKAPESQPVAPLAAGFRAGLGTEVDAHMWSAGVFSEIQLNRHWALSVGLSKAMYLGGLFITAYDFDNRTHRDFQKEFGRDLNPKLSPKDDIFNVDTRVQRFQIPLNLSYRIPLNRTLTILPALGTYLNLSSTEKVTCYFRNSPSSFGQAYFSVNRPVSLLNTFALSTAFEWQSKHLVLQGSPVLLLPTTIDPDWQQGATLGFRARAMYQF